VKVHRYLIQETLNGPEPDPEYHDCWRCGIGLKPNSLLKGCEDCNGLNQHKANPSQRRFMRGNFLPLDAAYEVSLHYPVRPDNDPTAATLCSMSIPYLSYYGTKDPVAVDWARALEPTDFEPDWPIVLITAYGQYVDHWTGYNLQALNRIPAARAAATHTPAEQRPVSTRELIAA